MHLHSSATLVDSMPPGLVLPEHSCSHGSSDEEEDSAETMERALPINVNTTEARSIPMLQWILEKKINRRSRAEMLGFDAMINQKIKI